MMSLDIHKKESGKLWHRKPTANDDGVILTISNNVASALAASSRNIRFLHAVFDVVGDSFVAGDYQGHIYKFDVHKNRMNLVRKTGSPCTALAYSMRRRSELLVAMADYSLRCLDTDSREEVASMKGHSSVIHNISLHASGRYALTSSQDTAQLWDLDTFQRKRKLNIKENVGIIKVFFLPLSNTIVTCFKDDSIFAWEADTLACKYQLTVPDGGGGKSPRFKAFAATRDGRTLVASGRSRYLHVWSLETRKLLRIVELPEKITAVRQLDFLNDAFDSGDMQVLGVLAQDGIMRFISLSTCKLLFDIGSLDQRINNVAVSPNGRHIAAVMDSGNIQLYSTQALTQEINKPPPPLVKVLRSNKMADSTGDTTGTLSGSRGTKAKKDHANSNMQWSQESTEMELPDGLSMPRLMAILKGYGEFPSKYRMFIWRSILRLPENHQAYGALVDKGTHPAYDKIHEIYPIKSRKLLRVLQRVLSALAHWAPIFGETDYLPMMAFPFVKLFQNNQLVCFEIISTVLVSWCQHWFEYFPNPPINMLGLVENALAHHDKELLQHYVRHGITSQMYAWPLLQTLFSEVLTREEWLRLFDNVFSNHPSYLLMVAVAYSITNRCPLLKCTEMDDFKYFFHHRNAVDVQQVVKEAYRLMDTTPDDIHPREQLEDFIPLTRAQYPVFNKYPKFIVDYQVQERERIRQEEVDYLRQRQLSQALQQDMQRKVDEEEAFYRQQKLLLDAEDKRRHLIAEEEQKLVDQRTRLAALDRETNLKKLHLMDATRRKFLAFQQQQKESELTRLDDEIRRKAALRDIETEAALDEAEIKHLELQLQRKAFEQDLMRQHAETTGKQRTDNETRRLQEELEDRKRRQAARADRDRDMDLRKGAEEKLGRVDNALADMSMRHDVELRQQVEDLEKERSMAQLARMTSDNRQLEAEIQDMMGNVEQHKLEEAQRRLHGLNLDQANSMDGEERRSRLLHSQNATQNCNQPPVGTSANMFDRLRDMQASARHPLPTHHMSERRRPYLNDTDSTDTSTQFSLDRGRDDFESRQRELMSDIRRMREKLATESRAKRPPATASYDM